MSGGLKGRFRIVYVGADGIEHPHASFRFDNWDEAEAMCRQRERYYDYKFKFFVVLAEKP